MREKMSKRRKKEQKAEEKRLVFEKNEKWYIIGREGIVLRRGFYESFLSWTFDRKSVHRKL